MNKLMLPIFALVILAMASSVFALDPEKQAMMPDSHRTDWVGGHQQAAKNDATSCKSCHKPFFCVDCHQRRDTTTERMHKRNYKFYHSVEARANPRRCDSCHKVSFCTDCHKNPR